MLKLADLFTEIHAQLDEAISTHWNQGRTEGCGFWRSGMIPEPRRITTCVQSGCWQAQASLDAISDSFQGIYCQLSTILVGGNSRIGIIIPNLLLDGVKLNHDSMRTTIAKSFDGREVNVVRKIGPETVFDKFFSDDPYSARWFKLALESEEARQILIQNFIWTVISYWESAFQALFMIQDHNYLNILIYSSLPLNSNITEHLPISIQSTHKLNDKRWITLAILPQHIDIDLAAEELRKILPNHNILIQEDLQ